MSNANPVGESQPLMSASEIEKTKQKYILKTKKK